MRGDNRTLTHALGDLHLAVRSFGGNGAQIFITRSKAISRPTYNKEYSTPVAFDERGVMKQITYRMQVEGGIRASAFASAIRFGIHTMGA
jgi:hypothetical protein